MSLTELIAQKQAIENQIEETTKAERKDAIASVKSLMEQYGITVEDLMKNTSKVTKKVAAKWQDPDSDKQWTGRGRTPLWFNEATAIKL